MKLKRELIAWGIALLVLVVLFGAREFGGALAALALIGVVTRVVVQRARSGVRGAVVFWAALGGAWVFLQYMGRVDEASVAPQVAGVLLALPAALYPIWPLVGKEGGKVDGQA
jgi:hypothetical protein